MKLAVIGGGINGIMAAWLLAEDGHEVTLYEKSELMSATSSASTKLLHGGLRYLETGHFLLVREALRERAWWLANAPHLTRPIKLLIPLYQSRGRPRWLFKVGLWLYDSLAGKTNIDGHQWLDRNQALSISPHLGEEGLTGAFAFFDGQMNDRLLGLWAAEQAVEAGVLVRQGVEIERVDTEGNVFHGDGQAQYDRVINVTGPWINRLLDNSGVTTRNRVELIRGSHVVLEGQIDHGYLLQSPDDSRVCFVLPYEGRILVGSTERRQTIDEPIRCSDGEADYLLRAYNAYFDDSRRTQDIIETFAGLRPLIRSVAEPAKMSREYAIEESNRLISVFGGKWTTARSLAEKIKKTVNQHR